MALKPLNAQSGEVLYEVKEHVAYITLNRPSVLNALNQELMQGLAQAFELARDDAQVRAVLMTGNGRAFSAGADLTTIPLDQLQESALGSAQKKSIDLGDSLRAYYNPLILSIRQLPKPVVSAVNGPVAGAGMSIALAADIVLAGRSASFLQAFARLGLVPDAGSTWFLPRLIGEQRSRALTLLAQPIDAQTALDYGLIYQLYEDADLMDRARALALKLATQATVGLGLIKKALDASANHTLEEQLSLEAQLQTQAGQTADFIEGVSAFIQKRHPVYKGR
jgi:2-(1,2-epoxy-1,2-dihydrophenyl)acetyl-CoA isomerase